MSERPRIAVITGAGSGIGRAVARALNADGWTVVLAGRHADTLEATRAQLAVPDRGLVVPTDVAQEQAVDALFDRTVAAYGRVDLLFNNAGTGSKAVPFDELPAAELRQVIDVNLWGVMLCARAAMRVMKRQTPQGGRIINNGSVSAYGPRPHSAPYAATKHGVTGLTKSITLDGRAYGIAACQIDIGNVATDMSAFMQTGALQANGTTMPEPRISSDHIGSTIVHIASLPMEANVPFITIMATNMPLYGRG